MSKCQCGHDAVVHRDDYNLEGTPGFRHGGPCNSCPCRKFRRVAQLLKRLVLLLAPSVAFAVAAAGGPIA